MIKFIKLQDKHLQTVLDWRVQPEIAQFMLTEVDYCIDKQRVWFNKISTDKTMAYWIVEYQGVLIGLINLAAIDILAKKCNAGFYIGDIKYRQLTAFLLPYFYNFIFKKLKFKKIYGEVLGANESILKIHTMQGYRHVGTFKNHIFKNGHYVDVHLVELMRDDWLLQKRYQRYEAEFEDALWQV
jgi:UDP-4-amino-4,6-dideoxy-N-acetyl-beta-L-altrosamine N-acetyltransferase